MLYVWEKAKKLGLSSIPSKFKNHYGTIPVGYSWDRDFLNEYFNVGLNLYNQNNYEDAYWVFSHLLELDKSDRLNASYFAINCNYEFGRYIAVLNICERFPQRFSGYLSFSKTLAMYVTYEKEEFEYQLRYSIQEFPHFAKFIAKKRKRNYYDLSKVKIFSGSKEEAQLYWNMQGKYWLQHPEAINIVNKFSLMPNSFQKRKILKYGKNLNEQN